MLRIPEIHRYKVFICTKVLAKMKRKRIFACKKNDSVYTTAGVIEAGKIILV